MQAIYRVNEPIVFTGYVDDFEHGVAAMEFSLDNGTTWTRYATDGARIDAGVRWSFEYTPREPGVYVLVSRTVNGEGMTSSVVSSQAFQVTQ